ncbi:preprotein translocase subunit SecY [Spiroplasma turonicum]|uniref:Protein translocase subunit SecY n=1 Tax=Spiroplasma turonicum TaxID=216946 RepID=A0A0K1P7J2_9MOLU|nr:preprotein translocase subunit SecY [Spiroplasma turonicum]AKU80250.1 preprotein translocase subunit SecY [Spiroplasma turonicum]ALX71251.1 preprotein translocase subunit SecY [Spiroplasma turonicum]
MALKANKTKAKVKKTKSLKNKNEFAKGNFFIRNKDLIKRIVFTLLVLVLIRAGTLLTVPGVSISSNFQSSIGNQEFFQLLSTLGGGSIGQFSIIALGVSPYITASIIVQLLSTDVIPVLTRWNKSGERGRRKLDRLTKVLTIPFALMQSTATIFTLSSQGLISAKWGTSELGSGPSWFYYILIPLVMLAGTFLMLWIADQITIKGIGNGISIIIFAGIVAQMPNNFKSTFQFWVKGNEDATILFDGILKFLIYVVSFLLVIFVVVLMNEAERKIPIQQTGSGLVDTKDHTPHLPLKINNAGVIPVIFASAIISTPMTVAQIIGANNPQNGFVLFTQSYLSFGTWWGIGIYGVLTILFTFLYAQVQINPEKIAENFKKSGTFIPGIKPGKDTEKFIQGTVNRLSILGSIFLAGIAVLPYIISKLTSLPSSLAIGGTGLIIVISVAIQTVQQLKGRLIQQSFLDKKDDKFTKTVEEHNSHIW